MATGNFVLDKGFNAGAAIAKYTAVKAHPSLAETVVPCTANDDVIIGFAQFDVTDDEIARGKGCSVRIVGITEAVATGAIDFGDYVQLESDGRVSKAASASGKRLIGKCMGHASTNENDRISMLIEPVGALAVGVTS